MKTDYAELIKSIIRNLVKYYSMSKRDTDDFSLKVFFSIEERFLGDLQSLGQELRRYLDSSAADCTIVIDDSRGSVNEKV